MEPIRTFIDDRTGEETAPQVESAFPYRANIDVVSAHPGGRFPWHWHGDVELFYLQSGCLEYHLPGGSTVFHAGDAGFVNAGVPHMTRAVGPEECRQQEHIFLPSLVAGAPGGDIERKYVAPLLKNPAADLIAVPAADPGSAALRALMDEAYGTYRARDAGYEIAIRERMSRAWLALLDFAPEPAAGSGRGEDRERIRAMLRYVEAHYDRPVSLAEIAAAANIGAREADRCFRRQLDATPFEYLLDYRLERARQLLLNTSLPVTETGLRCGFQSTSYFGRLFREKTGLSPSEYRRQAAKSATKTHAGNGMGNGDAEGARTLDLQRDRLAF